jgi:hypothetical protein
MSYPIAASGNRDVGALASLRLGFLVFSLFRLANCQICQICQICAIAPTLPAAHYHLIAYTQRAGRDTPDASPFLSVSRSIHRRPLSSSCRPSPAIESTRVFSIIIDMSESDHDEIGQLVRDVVGGKLTSPRLLHCMLGFL